MFSSRTDWNLSPNALHQLLEEKRTKGEPVIDLTESNPTRCNFSYDSALLQALATGRSLRYEPDPHGLLAARKAIAGYYGIRGVAVDPARVFITASTSEAYSHVFRLLCNAGDNVLVPKPSYPLFDYLCALNDVEVRHYRLRYDDEWRMDLDSVRDALDPSTKAVLLVHPNNPTGSFVRKEEKEALIMLAHERGIPLIVDEVFGEFAFEDTGEAGSSFAAENDGLVFTLNGISKLLGLPQMKLAWMTVSGEPQAVHGAVDRLEVICDTYLSTGTPIQHALPTLLRDGQCGTDQIKTRITANRALLRTMIAGSPVSVLNADGGWNAILRFPRIMPDETWALRILNENNVLVHPGHFFEIEEDACVVVSLLPEESVFLEGMGKLLKFVGTVLRR